MGAVLGRVLYHALQGRCFSSQSLPDESFFMDNIMARLGSENFTVLGINVFQKHRQTQMQIHAYPELQRCHRRCLCVFFWIIDDTVFIFFLVT